MSDAPMVSVVIPTHQRREALRRALRSLAGQTVPPEDFEVVVAVDGSTDGTWELLQSVDTPYALVAVAGPGRGRAAACNAAIARARGPVVIVLDDDMRVVPRFVAAHAVHHPPGSRCCVLGPVPVALDGSSPLAARHVQRRFAEHMERLARPGHVFVPRDFYSGNASLRREVLEEVGGFDERFTAYGNEDVELSLRLRQAGVTLRFDPEPVAHQEYGKGLRALARDTVAKGGTTVMLATAHPEVFGALRLAAPSDGSRAWLAARAGLLRLVRGRPRVAGGLFTAAAGLERAGLWRRPLFYRAVLDLAFWAGADAALPFPSPSAAAADGLPALAAELHRGPVDRLLHG